MGKEEKRGEKKEEGKEGKKNRRKEEKKKEPDQLIELWHEYLAGSAAGEFPQFFDK